MLENLLTSLSEEIRQVREELRLARAEPRSMPASVESSGALLSTEQAGVRLGVKAAAVCTYIGEGLLPATKVRGRWKLRADDCDMFVASQSKSRVVADDQFGRILRRVQGG